MSAFARFAVEESTLRDRYEWPWVIRDTREKLATAVCSSEATARTVVDGLNRGEAARSSALPNQPGDLPKIAFSSGPQFVDSA